MFNKVVLVGNLTRDIELRYLQQGGSALGKTGIAVTRKYTTNGEKREETCFIDLTFWGRQAEIANQYLRKGSKVLIEGRLKLDQWQDQNGQNRSKHSIEVENMEMLGSKDENSGYSNGGAQYSSNQSDFNNGFQANLQNRNYSQSTQNNSYQSATQQQRKPEPEYKEDIPEIDVDADSTIPF